METPVNVSEMLAKLPGGKSDDEPDWLNELEDDEERKEASDAQGSQSSDDPFAFLTTPGKSPLKSQATPTPGESSKPKVQEVATPQPTPQPTPQKSAGRGAGVSAPARVTIKNPDRIVFNRLLVELPYKESDCVDLSGDTGAVGRFIFTDRIRAHKPEDAAVKAEPNASADADAAEDAAAVGSEAGPSAAAQAGSGQEGVAEPDEMEEALVLDLKGVKFDAQIAALAGTACVVNIGPSGAKVEAVFNEFVHLDETSVFEDYEEVTDGTLHGWAMAEPDYGLAGDNAKPGSSKKQKSGPMISSGRVVKAAKRKGAGKARPSQKKSNKHR